MIKTSSEGTSYCTQCESWARENEKLRELLATERDAFGKKECELAKENRELKDKVSCAIGTIEILTRHRIRLEAVALAAETERDHCVLVKGDVADCRCRLCEALAALREGKP